MQHPFIPPVYSAHAPWKHCTKLLDTMMSNLQTLASKNNPGGRQEKNNLDKDKEALQGKQMAYTDAKSEQDYSLLMELLGIYFI